MPECVYSQNTPSLTALFIRGCRLIANPERTRNIRYHIAQFSKSENTGGYLVSLMKVEIPDLKGDFER